MKTYVTADLHFNHRNIASFCPDTRGHWNTREDPTTMNEDMVTMWNYIVAPDDLVYILGDVAFGHTKDAVNYTRRLNGRKILIKGNHDHKKLRDHSFRACFEEIHDYYELRYNGTLIIMCHYPIFDHRDAGRGSLMLHGHRHGDPSNLPGRIKDVGFDATGHIVTLLDDVVSELLKKEHMYHNNPIKV